MTESTRLLASRKRHREGETLSSHDMSSPDKREAKRLRHESRRLVKSSRTKRSALEELTPDVFCNVLDFLGATSKSLIHLLLVNKRFRKSITTIGDVMLPRALTHFRRPLLPKCAMESSTSLFIRHARICSRVLADVTHLRCVLAKPPDTIQGDEVRKGLKMTLDLLEVVPAFSEPLQKQILATCGKCGARAFKHSKLLLRAEDSLDGSTSAYQQEDLMKTSRLIMKTVVFRKLQLSKQALSSLLSFVQKRIEAKQLLETGCL